MISSDSTSSFSMCLALHNFSSLFQGQQLCLFLHNCCCLHSISSIWFNSNDSILCRSFSSYWCFAPSALISNQNGVAHMQNTIDSKGSIPTHCISWKCFLKYLRICCCLIYRCWLSIPNPKRHLSCWTSYNTLSLLFYRWSVTQEEALFYPKLSFTFYHSRSLC